ncbi:GTP pyrophosphokinase [Planctomycetes bacterium Poly30]|uniref:GTP pyrophosphokinase n=1 Tax=Saltatorellus ferox TaxID=2528018 RepID=A0A518EZ66_9BACT|nr:GTP pyrophosphokinase [Planctomycetes bacterium Poly30]
MTSASNEHFSDQVELALRISMEAHAGQTRKGQLTPYVTHPIHVALLLARAGADDLTLQAALLHDVVEDCEGWTLEGVETLFGAEVARTVCDLTEDMRGSWESRKQAALDQVAEMEGRSLAVKTADKLHNMQTLLASLSAAPNPSSVWDHFSRGPGPTIGYARQLAEALMTRLREVGEFEPLGEELLEVVDRLERFVP